jgi:hypothetical protein
VRESFDQQEDRIVSSESAITLRRRQAGDSLDFHARHGRALQARAAREGIEALLSPLRMWRRNRIARGRGWHVQWPVGAQASHGTRR